MKFLLSLLFFSVTFANEFEYVQKHKIGIFHPYKYQLSEEIEISTHPITFLINPNVSARIEHNKKFIDFVFSVSKADNAMKNKNNSFYTNHSIYFPTGLFNMLKKEGMFGFISPEFSDFPFMMSLKNEVEIFVDKDPYNISIKTGFTFGFSSEKLDTRSTIDLPIIYPRMLVYYPGSNYNFNYNLGIKRKLSKKWDVFTNINGIVYPKSGDGFFIENKSLLIWNYSEKTEIQFGYKLVYGQYPFGDMLHLLPFSIMPVPLIDIVWSW